MAIHWNADYAAGAEGAPYVLVVTNDDYFLLLESGDFVLLESGDKILLEAL